MGSNATLPASAADARAAGSPRYFTGKPCKRGHVSERFTVSNLCIECARHHDNKRGPAKRADPAYKLQNHDRLQRKYRGDPAWREAMLAKGKQWRAENADRHRDMIKDWEDRNPHSRPEKLARYRAAKLQRTLALSGQSAAKEAAAIRLVYERAQRLSDETGVLHEVDHVIPLQGRTVSGLHVSWNLEAIPMRDNRAKGNRLIAE